MQFWIWLIITAIVIIIIYSICKKRSSNGLENQLSGIRRGFDACCKKLLEGNKYGI